MGHELRTPLTQILLYAETLRLARPTPEAKSRAAEVIEREARRLIQMVEGAMHFVSSSRSQASLEIGDHDLAALLRDMHGGLDKLARREGSRVVLGAEVEARARVDPEAMRRVVQNLFDNAISHGPPGQSVRVDVYEEDGEAVVSIQDQGPGYT